MYNNRKPKVCLLCVMNSVKDFMELDFFSPNYLLKREESFEEDLLLPFVRPIPFSISQEPLGKLAWTRLSILKISILTPLQKQTLRKRQGSKLVSLSKLRYWTLYSVSNEFSSQFSMCHTVTQVRTHTFFFIKCTF